MKLLIFYLFLFLSTSLHSQTINKEKSFELIEEYLITDKCKDIIGTIDRNECVRNELNNFFNKNFDFDLLEDLPKGNYKSSIKFHINKDQEIIEVIVDSKQEILKEELTRIIKLLPDNFKLKNDEEEITEGDFRFPIFIKIDQ